jgi:hypothetical protein
MGGEQLLDLQAHCGPAGAMRLECGGTSFVTRFQDGAECLLDIAPERRLVVARLQRAAPAAIAPSAASASA